jgi:3-oxoacyl-ACP reductase-like protein
MSVLGKIVSAIFGHASAAPAPGPSTPAAPAAPTASAAPKASSAPAGASAAPVDVAAILTKLAASNKERLDWKKSIVDLMKLLGLDSSLAARKELADELHYTGDKNDSATMNIWLHKQVMLKLAENGGKVPNELRK